MHYLTLTPPELHGCVLKDYDLEAACRKATRIEVVRMSDNSGTAVYLANANEYAAAIAVPNSTCLFGVWCYYSQDVAAFCKRSNPSATVLCESHGRFLDFAEQLKQW